jgi:hypothetical protein
MAKTFNVASKVNQAVKKRMARFRFDSDLNRMNKSERAWMQHLRYSNELDSEICCRKKLVELPPFVTSFDAD